MTTSFRGSNRNRRSRFTQPTATEPMATEPTATAAGEENGAIDNAFIATCTAPAKLMGWLTSNRGGKAIVGILALYCAGLSVEAWYVTLPRVVGQRTEENRKFMPKPFIDDGADLGLLNPLNAVPAIWDMAMGVFESMPAFRHQRSRACACALCLVRLAFLYCAAGFCFIATLAS